MNAVILSPYFVYPLLAVVAVLLWKLFDQKNDKKQAEWQEIGEALDRFGWNEAGAMFKAFARDGYEEFVSLGRAIVGRLRAKNGVEEVMCTSVIKALRDPDFRSLPSVKERLDPVLAESALGFLLDDETQANMALLAPVLGEYGSIEFQNLFAALGANKLSQAKTHFQAIITLLRNKDRLDDELMARADKALPRIVKADAAHYAKLKAIIDSIPDPNAAAAKPSAL